MREDVMASLIGYDLAEAISLGNRYHVNSTVAQVQQDWPGGYLV